MITITANDHKKIARGLKRLLVKEFRRYKNVQNILHARQKRSAN